MNNKYVSQVITYKNLCSSEESIQAMNTGKNRSFQSILGTECSFGKCMYSMSINFRLELIELIEDQQFLLALTLFRVLLGLSNVFFPHSPYI